MISMLRQHKSEISSTLSSVNTNLYFLTFFAEKLLIIPGFTKHLIKCCRTILILKMSLYFVQLPLIGALLRKRRKMIKIEKVNG